MQAPEAALPSQPIELVRAAVKNELKDRDPSARYAFRLRKESQNGSSIKEVAETNDGEVSYLLEVNDKPLTDEQRQGEAQRLQKLLQDRDERQRRLKDQKSDEERAQKMVRALPDAFIYEYDGATPASAITVDHGPEGQPRDLVRLRFKPNPQFDPPNHESQVFKGMDGAMWIDPVAQRIAKIDGHLFQDVNFGWGIFGRLNKGGHFLVAQANVGDNIWMNVATDLDFTGKILLFKRLRIKQKENASNFRRIPANLSYGQGLEILKRDAEQQSLTQRGH